MFMLGVLIFIVFIAGGILIFSAPARIPVLRQWAMTHRAKRWAVIILLGLLPTLVNYVAFVRLKTEADLIFARLPNPCLREGNPEPCAKVWFEDTFALDYELKGEFANEVTLRHLLFSAEGRCFSNNSAICEAATSFLTMQQGWQSYHPARLSDYFIYFMSILTFLFPSYLTGYLVYRITHDNRKQKHS